MKKELETLLLDRRVQWIVGLALGEIGTIIVAFYLRKKLKELTKAQQLKIVRKAEESPKEPVKPIPFDTA